VLGAVVHADDPSKTEREWPFYPPRDVKPPAVAADGWVRNGIDAFIYSKLADQGLKPAPEASGQQLVRRLYLDLIGLPPSPADVERFVNDTSENAYERLVDRLLKHPGYGERWARLWLDLARYADTAGYEGDPDLPHAWRYRDYVIDSLSKDKPYDLFIREQIAGDEFDEIMGAGDLPATPPERTVALTFLRLAPFTEPRGDETRHELLSEMTSTVSSVFLGLTMGCARCHDHRYDSIPTRDFYRLKAFFSTVSIPRPEPGDGFQIGGSIPAAFYRDGEEKWAAARRSELQRSVVEAREELQQLQKSLSEKLGSAAGTGLQAMGDGLGNHYIFGRSRVNDGSLHTSVINCDGNAWTFFTDGQGPEKTGSRAGSNQGQWFHDLPAVKHVTLGQYSAGSGEIRTGGAQHVGEFAQILIYDHPLSEQERTALNNWIRFKYSGRQSDPGPAAATGPPQTGLRFWLDATDLDADPDTDNPDIGTAVARWTDRVGGISLSQKNSAQQPGLVQVSMPGSKEGFRGAAAVQFENDFLSGPLSDADFAQDGAGALVTVFTARHTHEGYGFEVGGNGRFLSTFINPGAAGQDNLAALIESDAGNLISREERRRFRWLSSRERLVKQQLKRLTPVAMSLRHSYGPPYEPGVPTSRVMIRGEYDNPGEVVEAGFPGVIAGHQNPAAIRLDPFKRWPTRSRRMALAQWIASAENPLTARVLVNRLWYWHLGRGIVETPSDFGALSGGPSHRELLDWLAVQFVASKWSLKALHRLIVMSATYRQTSIHENPRAADVDPDNTLLWKFRRRRLEAEAVRDSVLAVSGRLNTEQFGLPIFPPLPDDIAELVKYTTSKWDTQTGPEGRRRSIYIYQQRTLAMPFLQAFDSQVCDESRPRRRHSVTPLQALAMYNGPFVSGESRYFAERVLAQAGPDSDSRIEYAFRLALSRGPTPDEVALMKQIESSSHSPAAGLVGVCRILLNSSEFVYVD